MYLRELQRGHMNAPEYMPSMILVQKVDFRLFHASCKMQLACIQRHKPLYDTESLDATQIAGKNLHVSWRITRKHFTCDYVIFVLCYLLNAFTGKTTTPWPARSPQSIELQSIQLQSIQLLSGDSTR